LLYLQRGRTFATLVSACRRAGEIAHAESLVATFHGVGKHFVVSVYEALMVEQCRLGRTEAALDLEKTMIAVGVRPNDKSRATLLSSLLRARAHADALVYVRSLRAAGGPYDLPLYNVMLQAMLANGDESGAREILGEIQAAGLTPSEYTLNVLLKGFASSGGSLEAALEVFNAFTAAGGTPGLISYNILISGFARQGQLLNCEALLEQLWHSGCDERAASAAASETLEYDQLLSGTEATAGADQLRDLSPDRYTYNAMMLACNTAGEPQRALQYRQQMVAEGVPGDLVTLTMLADALTADERPLDGLAEARRLLESGELTSLDAACYTRLFHACAVASGRPEARPHARDALLWLLNQMAGEHGMKHKEPTADVLEVAAPPWHARDAWIRDVVRTLGNIGDFKSARRQFDRAPQPRSYALWEEMLRVCNICGEPGGATEILMQQPPSDAGSDA
jgi:pentatricopeptide repeat protein